MANKKKRRRTANHACSACGNKPARPHMGLHGCNACRRMPVQRFLAFASEWARLNIDNEEQENAA